MLATLRSAGAPSEEIEKVRAQLRARVAGQAAFAVWPCNWYAFKVFTGLQTQWNVAIGMGGAAMLGLNYLAIDPVLRAHKRCEHRVPYPELMRQLQVLERVALEVFAKEAKS